MTKKTDVIIDTKKQILDIAEDFLLDRGYNGFSYKDISGALNIKNASIHYHFPKKTDLCVAIIHRAIKRFERWASDIDRKDLLYSKKMDEFFLAFKQYYVENNQHICLGGTLETDFNTLPEEIQNEIRHYASSMLQWLENFLVQGKKRGEFKFPGSARDQALLIIASLQGIAQIVRVTSPVSFDATVKQIKRYVCV
jgi:TetR/AcrR family transcriptional regulator, transcriptional repressor for nem operon